MEQARILNFLISIFLNTSKLVKDIYEVFKIQNPWYKNYISSKIYTFLSYISDMYFSLMFNTTVQFLVKIILDSWANLRSSPNQSQQE